MIPRQIETSIRGKLTDEKAIVLLGPRQTGKSTLLRQLEPHFKKPVLWMNGDETDVRNLLASPTSTALKNIIGNSATWVIDEAQRIENSACALR